MTSQRITIRIPTGMHLKPTGQMCKLAASYPCTIWMKAAGECANAKSVLSVLSLSLRYNEEIEVCCDGEREEEALKAIVAFIKEIGD